MTLLDAAKRIVEACEAQKIQIPYRYINSLGGLSPHEGEARDALEDLRYQIAEMESNAKTFECLQLCDVHCKVGE